MKVRFSLCPKEIKKKKERKKEREKESQKTRMKENDQKVTRRTKIQRKDNKHHKGGRKT